MIEARQTSHSGAISKLGGRLATSTKRLVSLIACLSNDAIPIASPSTNASRPEAESYHGMLVGLLFGQVIWVGLVGSFARHGRNNGVP
jgi:hypothetical protein